MAWVYQCAEDNMTLRADSKEQLAQMMVQHMSQEHDQQISMQRAMENIDKQAQQAA